MNLVIETAAWLANPLNWSGPHGIPSELEAHVALSGASLLVAILIALPIGLAIGHTGRAASLAVNLANLGRALPSFGVIGLLAPFTALIDPQLGFKVYPTFVAMVVLAIPPVLVNAYAGVSNVDRDLVEAARAMGMRERQILGNVEIPVALPVIVGGIRSGAVQIIATATLGAIIGGPGLGQFLVLGIAQQDDGMVFGGVVLVAGLALATEGAFAMAQRALGPGRAARRPPVPTVARTPT